MFTGHDIDSITCRIRQTITDIANDTIPNRIISIRKDNPPWLTTAIKKNKFDAKKEFINIKVEGIKGVIKNRRSKKDRRHNGENKKGQQDKQRSTKHYAEN